MRKRKGFNEQMKTSLSLPIFMISSVTLLCSSKGRAETGPFFNFCAAQIQQFCPTEQMPGQIFACLKKNDSELSLECKEELKRAARALDQAKEQSGRSLSVLGGLSSQAPPFPVLAYEGILGNGKPSTRDHRLNGSVPLYQTSTDYLALSLAAAQVSLDESLSLGPDLQTPKNLYRAEIGSQYTHQLPEHRSWGVRGSVGYATDHFSGKFRDTIFNLNFQYSYPGTNGGYWTWFVFLSNNSPFGNYIPLPGFIYFYKGENFTAAWGFPVTSLQWTPQKDWAYSLSATGPAITAEAAYGQIRSIQIFTAANWNNQSFILEKRQEDKERLTLEDKKAALGLRSFIFERMQVEAKTGYAFDRQIYVGEGFRDMRRGSTHIDSDWFLSWAIKSAF